MGCDIHLYTEKESTINNTKKWVNVDHFKINPYYEKGDDSEDKLELCSVYSDRDYWLFSVLANVRNGDNNSFISYPKGIPVDCCKITKGYSDSWNNDGHSHSYFTLKELKDFNSSKRIINVSGMIAPEQAKDLDNGKTPDSWCGYTNAEGYVATEWTIENKSLSFLIDKLERRKWDEFWMFNQEEETTENDDKFRIVFWFDN